MTLPAVRSSTGLSRRWDQQNPFAEFEDLYQQMGRWMDSLTGGWGSGTQAWSPLADVSETDEAYEVQIDLPGVEKDDISIEVTGNQLSVTGEVRESVRKGLLRHQTRRTGRFHYQVGLPQEVDSEHIEAHLDKGVLNIRAPKTEAAKPRRIAITGR